MAPFHDVIIHIGLHKTASTFLQKEFFPLHAESSGYIDARKQMRGFLDDILYTHDFEFDPHRTRQTAAQELNSIGAAGQRILLSDEQLCGSPWDNAILRKTYFDRLTAVFPAVRFIVVLRNQEDMIRSLYLQYIKTGGTADWRSFFNHKKHPLCIGLKAYLNYGTYIQYMVDAVGMERVGCFFYEEMRANPIAFLKTIADFADFNIKEKEMSKIIDRKKNPSITNFWVGPLRYINALFKSYRHPFHLLPRTLHKALVQTLARIPIQARKDLIPPEEITRFCEAPKQQNKILAALFQKDISQLGY